VSLDAVSGGPDEVFITAGSLVQLINPMGPNAPLIVESMGITSAVLTDGNGHSVGTLVAPNTPATMASEDVASTTLSGNITVSFSTRMHRAIFLSC